MDHNWVKIIHLVQKRVFGVISLKWFLSTYCTLSSCKVQNPPFCRSCDKSLYNFESQSGQNCPYGPNEKFWGNFTLVIFFYLMFPIIQNSLKKSFGRILWYKLQYTWAISSKWGSSEKSHNSDFCLLLMLYHAAKLFKKSLEQILRYICLYNFGPKLCGNCPFGPKV